MWTRVWVLLTIDCGGPPFSTTVVMHARTYHFVDVVARIQRQALDGTAPQELVGVVHAAGDAALHGVDAHLG